MNERLEGFVIQYTGPDGRPQWLRSMSDRRRAAIFSRLDVAYRASMGLKDPRVIDLAGDLNVCVINSAN